MSEKFISADHPDIQYSGRFDMENPAAPRFAWSGSTIRFRFRGTGAGVLLRHDTTGSEYRDNYYTVLIDDRQPAVFHVAASDSFLQIAAGLSDAEHDVTLFRRTEAMCGVGVFGGIRLDPGADLLSPSPLPGRKIEFIGNSITCGYGNEAASENEDFLPETEDGYRAYSAITARNLAAEYRAVCYSGRGIFRNYDGSQEGLVSQMFEQIVPQSQKRWDFSRWQPDVVVVNLGTNDFASGIPEANPFVSAYTAFIKRIRSVYPGAAIICLDGPMLSGETLSTCQSYIKHAVAASKTQGIDRVFTFSLTTQGALGYGADWHPNLAQHELNARELTAFIQETLGW